MPDTRDTESYLSVSSKIGGRLSLLVMTPDGVSTVPLPEGADIVIGREPGCDVCIDDTKLSRRHARLRVGARVEVIDLESRNGTLVRGEPIKPNEPAELLEGDVITVGATALLLQGAPSATRPRRVWSHGYFETRLEEECERAGAGAAPFAVVRARFADATAASAEAVKTTLVALLRATDIVASYTPTEYELLLTGTDVASAERLARDLQATLRSTGSKVQMGIAAYPRDGRTPEALVEAATPAIHPGASEGHSAAMVSALARLEPIVTRVAAGTITVLLLGETGVGKDVLARTIHARSPRASKPIVCINCAALSESLLESELFGHEKGAFTGATHEKHGLIEAAAGGTVFLDEIGEMPLSVQAKLLRVIEQREVLRVGAVAPRSVDVRFLAATNRDLDVEVAEKRFRQDLYFRLNAISLVIPPLRDRLDEIEPLARGFIAEACQRAGLRAPVALDPDALALLKNYRWPGNIRELRNVIERAVLLCGDGVIQLVHLPTEKMGALLPPPSRLPTGIAHLAIRSPVAPRSVPAPRQTLPTMSGEEPSGAEIERARIVAALEQCGGNQSDAARALGISRSTLISRIQTYGLPRPRKREDDK